MADLWPFLSSVLNLREAKFIVIVSRPVRSTSGKRLASFLAELGHTWPHFLFAPSWATCGHTLASFLAELGHTWPHFVFFSRRVGPYVATLCLPFAPSWATCGHTLLSWSTEMGSRVNLCLVIFGVSLLSSHLDLIEDHSFKKM